jgi:hypothetical protein
MRSIFLHAHQKFLTGKSQALILSSLNRVSKDVIIFEEFFYNCKNLTGTRLARGKESGNSTCVQTQDTRDYCSPDSEVNTTAEKIPSRNADLIKNSCHAEEKSPLENNHFFLHHTIYRTWGSSIHGFLNSY